MVNLLRTIPNELRQDILQRVLVNEDLIGIQGPKWENKKAYILPIACTCRELRDEAIEVFYKINHFVALLHVPAGDTVDIANYPMVQDSMPPNPLTAVVPWTYPHLLRDLRHLHLEVNIKHHLQNHGRIAHAASLALEQRLFKIMNALDFGARLKGLSIHICDRSTKRAGGPSHGDMKALQALSRFKVRGPVLVQVVNGRGVAVRAEISYNLQAAIQVTKPWT